MHMMRRGKQSVKHNSTLSMLVWVHGCVHVCWYMHGIWVINILSSLVPTESVLSQWLIENRFLYLLAVYSINAETIIF